MQEHTLDAAERLEAFARGELTWAEVEGMTAAQAQAVACTACELAADGRLAEARVLLEGLVAGNPRDAAARAALGTVYQKLGRTEEALAEYAGALAEAPRHPVALAHRGELLLKRGEVRAGLADLAAAVEADPRGETAAARRARALVDALALAVAERLRARGPQA